MKKINYWQLTMFWQLEQNKQNALYLNIALYA